MDPEGNETVWYANKVRVLHVMSEIGFHGRALAVSTLAYITFVVCARGKAFVYKVS